MTRPVADTWQVQVTSDTTVVQFAVTAPSYEEALPLIEKRLDEMTLPAVMTVFIARGTREHWMVDDAGPELHQGLRDECADERCREGGEE